MKLTLKLTVALVGIMLMLFFIYGYLTARRQSGFFERDMRRDALYIGRTLALAVSHIWESEGKDDALRLVAETNDKNEAVTIRLVDLSPQAEERFRPELPRETLSALRGGSFFVTRGPDGGDAEHLYTYVRVRLKSEDDIAIELRESFEPTSSFTNVSIIRVAVFFGIVIVSMAVVMWLLGIVMVARPINRLREKTKRLATGDFSGHAHVEGSDEIALLGHEINAMSDRLLETRKLLNEEIDARLAVLEQLRHADRLTTIGTLASGVAHELGTPLNVISGNAAMLAAGGVQGSEAGDLARTISQQTEKMAGIVRQLLDFARKRTPEKKEADLSALITRVVQMLAPFAEKRDLLLRAESLPGAAPALIDENQIEQVLINLVMNAVQAVQEGEIVVGLRVQRAGPPHHTEHEERDCYCLFVRDQGPGMSEKQIEQVFDPFYTTKAPGQGTGMGLSIAHGIVHEHQGWIAVTSKAEQGSCFSVYLPILREL